MTDTEPDWNQPPPMQDVNLYAGDRALRQSVSRGQAEWAEAELTGYGHDLGRAETLALGAAANENPPHLHVLDRFGNRRDEVEFHPAWHEMLGRGVAQGLHSAPWTSQRPGGHVARAAGVILHTQAEAGSQCPMTMTYAAVPVLRRHADAVPQIGAQFLPKILGRHYDPAFRPVSEKTGALIGMALTEKQGGSDLRAMRTVADPVGHGEFRIQGHKWFMSAPMCDAFLVLAQGPGGLSCFFVPRFLPDGKVNGIQLQRLKDKLGNRSNASSEVEFVHAAGWLLGAEGRGVPTILEMGNYTRLDCALGSAGLMRAAVAQALHHASHRTAFDAKLRGQPLMKNVLADLALESEAATVLAMRLARAFDSQTDNDETHLRRLLTPVAKYWICKRAPMLAAEAMEVLGGNGYVEDSGLPRIYRETPVNSIWEGSGNVIVLDALRAIARTPQVVEPFFAELLAAKGHIKALDARIRLLEEWLEDPTDAEYRGRVFVENLAIAMQAALLIRESPPFVAEAFCASRFGPWTGAFGALPAGLRVDDIIDRAMPAT